MYRDETKPWTLTQTICALVAGIFVFFFSIPLAIFNFWEVLCVFVVLFVFGLWLLYRPL